MFDRRTFVKSLAVTGIGPVGLYRAIAVAVDAKRSTVTPKMVRDAEWIHGIELTEEQRQTLAKTASETLASLIELRKVEVDFFDLPATHSEPLRRPPSDRIPIPRVAGLVEDHPPRRPTTEEALAFLPVTELAALLRSRQVTSVELTRLYLARLKKYGPMLRCVVNLTESLAMRQAERADAEITAGRYRGPLHGIPWGAKDLISVPGYPTTWGIPQFRKRILHQTATVAARLEEAGAVLVAKLSLGAIAMGDKWFGGMTRNPWNPKVGSSGSSAGSASATVAGLTGFTLGSETLGSILSPCRRCGATGLRPTFGRVSRQGCMPLSWSMDKIGPLARSVEDCALVFATIHGTDGMDPTVADYPFEWPARTNLCQLTVGYTARKDKPAKDRADLAVLRELGVRLVEVKLPDNDPAVAMAHLIDVEAATIFDRMLRNGEIDGWNTWPETFREAQFITAVDYLRLQRMRRKLMHEMEELMSKIDVLFHAPDLYICNQTGHPSVVIPFSFVEKDNVKTPSSVWFTGRLNDESTLLPLAVAYQNRLDAHLARPPLEAHLKRFKAGEFPDQETPTDQGGGRQEGQKD